MLYLGNAGNAAYPSLNYVRRGDESLAGKKGNGYFNKYLDEKFENVNKSITDLRADIPTMIQVALSKEFGRHTTSCEVYGMRNQIRDHLKSDRSLRRTLRDFVSGGVLASVVAWILQQLKR